MARTSGGAGDGALFFGGVGGGADDGAPLVGRRRGCVLGDGGAFHDRQLYSESGTFMVPRAFPFTASRSSSLRMPAGRAAWTAFWPNAPAGGRVDKAFID